VTATLNGRSSKIAKSRAAFGWFRQPFAGAAACVVVIVALAVYSASASSYNLYIIELIVVFAIAAVGQQWLIGGAGQVSLGGGAVMAIGAYTAGAIQQWGGAFPTPLIGAAVAAGVVGLIVGLPSARLRGFYLVLATLALNFIVTFFGERYEVSHPAGMSVSAFTIGSSSSANPQTFILVAVVILVLACAFLWWNYRMAPGAIWMVVRESETSARTMGISPTVWKLSAFIGSSAITGLAGGLYAYLINDVAIEDFSLTLSINLVLMVYLGGVDSIVGAIIGAALLELVPIGLQHLGANMSSSWLSSNTSLVQSLIFGAFLMLILLSDATGIVGLAKSGARWTARRVSRSHPTDAVEGAATEAPQSGSSFFLAAKEESSHAPAATEASGALLTASRRSGAASIIVQDLRVVYKTGAVGVSGISFSVPPEKIVAIVGRNAAGKTSTVRAISGFPRAERVSVSGSVIFDGHEVAGLRPRQTAALGIAIVSEREKVFPTLSVLDNLRAVGLSAREAGATIDRIPELARLGSRPAGLLSGGQRQLLALSAVVARRPKAILVDELSLGLAPIAVTSLMNEIKRIHQEHGTTVLLVDQALGALSRVIDYAYVLENGAIVGEGPAEVLQSGQVHSLVVGGEV
jgi:branched-chain amino acid transport system permease protein